MTFIKFCDKKMKKPKITIYYDMYKYTMYTIKQCTYVVLY